MKSRVDSVVRSVLAFRASLWNGLIDYRLGGPLCTRKSIPPHLAWFQWTEIDRVSSPAPDENFPGVQSDRGSFLVLRNNDYREERATVTTAQTIPSSFFSWLRTVIRLKRRGKKCNILVCRKTGMCSFASRIVPSPSYLAFFSSAIRFFTFSDNLDRKAPGLGFLSLENI